MIVRRIIVGFRRLEWGTALIELLIVAVGIFLGLKVNNWNEGQKEVVEGYVSLDFLRRQLDDEIVEYEELTAGLAEQNTKITQIALMLYADSWTEEEFDFFKSQHWTVYTVFYGLKKPHALKQLVEQGKIDLVRSIELQEKLFDFDAAYDASIGQDKVGDQIVAEAIDQIILGMQYGTREDLMAIPVSHNELLEDRELKSAFRLISIMNGFQLESLNRLHDSSKELRDDLNDYLSDRYHP